MRPLTPKNDRKDDFIYPFSPILIGEANDLATPLGLAMLKDSLSHVGFLANKQPPAGEVGPSISFEPGSDDSANTSSLESTSSPSSSIIAGAPGNPTSEASRIRCGQEIERSLDRALVSGLDPNFQPWMASTGSTPPSERPPSSQSLPTDLEGSGSSGSSPQRPNLRLPQRAGKGRRFTDRAYKQPSIRNFLTPSPPTSPASGRSSLPNRLKRRSQRPPPGVQPSPKKLARDNARGVPQHNQEERDQTRQSPSPVEEIVLEEPAIMAEIKHGEPRLIFNDFLAVF